MTLAELPRHEWIGTRVRVSMQGLLMAEVMALHTGREDWTRGYFSGIAGVVTTSYVSEGRLAAEVQWFPADYKEKDIHGINRTYCWFAENLDVVGHNNNEEKQT